MVLADCIAAGSAPGLADTAEAEHTAGIAADCRNRNLPETVIYDSYTTLH